MRGFRCGLILALLGFVLAASDAGAAALKSVTLTQSSQSLNFVPIYIAQTEGYFRDAGLKVNVVLAGGGPKAMTALVGGGAEFSASVLFDGIMAHRRGLTDVRAIANLSYFQAPFVVSKDIAKKRHITLNEPLHERIAALHGLRFGITTPGASSDLVLRYLLLTNAFNPDRFLQIVPVGGISSQMAALQAGQIDGCSCLPGIDVVTERLGLTVSIIDQQKDIPALNAVPYGTLFSRAPYLKTHPEIGRAMLTAIARAEALIAHDPAAAARATSPFFKQMHPDTYAAAWKAFLPFLPTSPVISHAGYSKELAFEKKMLPPGSNEGVPYDQVVDRALADAAVQTLH